MKAYLFGWNPQKFEWADIDDDIKQLADTGKLEDNWSVVSHKTIRPGDRAYIVRVGVEPKGIFAAGIIASEAYPAYRNGRHYYRITIALDVLLNPVNEPILLLRPQTFRRVSNSCFNGLKTNCYNGNCHCPNTGSNKYPPRYGCMISVSI
jgi:hypothetical protein